MSDTSWIRTWNSKGIYTDTGTIYNTGHAYFACNSGYNVGIGTSAPSYKLHVSGDIYTTTGFKKNGSSNSYVLLGGGGHYSLTNILHGDSYGTMEETISNCNSVDRTGIYSSGRFSNRPSGISNWGTLFNLRLYKSNNLYHRQLFFDCYSSDRIWTRSADNGSWTGWKELITTGNIGLQSVSYATKSGYSRSLLGRSTSGSDYDSSTGNLVFAEWNTMSDNRWYLKATGYECRVNYASSAGNADTLDGNHASAFATAGHNHFTRLSGTNIDTGLANMMNWHYEISNATGTLPFTETWR